MQNSTSRTLSLTLSWELFQVEQVKVEVQVI